MAKPVEYIDELPRVRDLPNGAKVSGPSRATVLSVEVHGTRYQLPGSWGADDANQADDLRRQAAAIYPEVCKNSLPSSAGSLVGRLLRTTIPHKHRRQLKPRYRFLTRNYHVGPMLVMTGGLNEKHTHYDIKNAYYYSMSKPLPVVRSYRAVSPRWGKDMIENVRPLNGFFKGTVYVPDFTGESCPGIGPLPTRANVSRQVGKGRVSQQVVTWPTGYVTGCWPISMVTNAVDCYGATVVKVEQMAVSGESSLFFKPYLDCIDKARSKSEKIWKLMYQRAWTKCKPSEWYTGTVINGRVEWKYNTIDWLSNKIHPDRIMRPDITASVAAHNAIEVINKVNTLPLDSVASVHVDSIHVRSDVRFGKTGNKPGQWRKVQSGLARFWNVGDYSYLTGLQGEEKALSPDAMMVLQGTRRWAGNPATCAAATSDPPHASIQLGEPTSRKDKAYRHWKTVDRSIWDNSTFGGLGWTRDSARVRMAESEDGSNDKEGGKT